MSIPVDSLAICSSDGEPGAAGWGADVLVIDILPSEAALLLPSLTGGGCGTPWSDRVDNDPDGRWLKMVGCGYRHNMESPLGAFLTPAGYAGPRGLRAIAREGSAVVEAARLVRRTAGERIQRRDTPYATVTPIRPVEPVVLVPGFMAGDSSLALLARHLRRIGFRTYRSTMHANVGCTKAASDALERRIEAIAIKRDRKVSIVGHSLGGLLARGIAARRPDLVDGIVTLGSPLLAPGAVHPVLAFDLALVVALRRAGLGAMMGADCTNGDCAKLSWEQSQLPLAPGIGFTSVFSRRDGVVDWRGCLDPRARTIEVGTSHLGMAVDPVVFDVVTAALHKHRARREQKVTPATLPAVPDVTAG
jgi:pimeloyl-ACP methyl ester carboxylesterase